MPDPIQVFLLSCIVSKSILSTIWLPSFFVRKSSAGKRIILQLLVLANCFIRIRLIICQVVFHCTITTCSSRFRIEIITTTLLFSITILLLLKRPLLAFVSIALKGLLSCYHICSIKGMNDVN